MSVIWLAWAGPARSRSTSFRRFCGSVLSRKARASETGGMRPAMSRDTRRKNSASPACGAGVTPSFSQRAASDRSMAWASASSSIGATTRDANAAGPFGNEAGVSAPEDPRLHAMIANDRQSHSRSLRMFTSLLERRSRVMHGPV
jgi:hypothetical protein